MLTSKALFSRMPYQYNFTIFLVKQIDKPIFCIYNKAYSNILVQIAKKQIKSYNLPQQICTI